MIVHSYYEEDPRVRREAESLVAAGRPVDVFALRRPGDAPTATVDGVTVHHLDVQRHQGAPLPVYLAEYLTFLVRALFAATRAHRRRRYGLVQVHSLPDFLVFAALPLRAAGVPVVLDLHETMPDMFRSRFPGAANPVTNALLLAEERASIAAATHVITVHEARRRRLERLGIPTERMSIVINSPSLSRFDPAQHPTRQFAEDGSTILVYAGALTPIYELDVTVDAVAILAATRPDLGVRLELYGRGDSEPALREQAARRGIADRVTFHGRIPLHEVPAAVARADIGLAPTRLDAFTEATISTKIFEYGAMRKPVVASRLPLVEETFPDGSVRTYDPGNPAAMAEAIAAFADDPDAREGAVEATLARVRDLAWEREAERYVALVDRLAHPA
jgi:glycosyltransferase involved in cell wall biosynthesis